MKPGYWWLSITWQPPIAKQEDIEPMQSSPQENNGFEKVEKEVRCESSVEDFVLVPDGLQGENSGIHFLYFKITKAI